MDEKAKECRKKYYREWRAKNPIKCKEYRRRYLENRRRSKCAVNEYGAPLDRNGYAPSILQDDENACFICFGCAEKLDRHEVFGGPNREKSKRLGLWVSLCHWTHHVFGRDSVHQNAQTNRAVKQFAQKAAMEKYGWTKDDFIREFGRNYLDTE